MREIEIRVQEDHIKTMAATKRPVIGIIELIWNGLDADANRVEVTFERNRLDVIDIINVVDNGSGINYLSIDNDFGNLGGSWKRQAQKTKEGRVLHGKLGKGRFRAFSLGAHVTWSTCYNDDGSNKKYSIQSELDRPKQYQISDQIECKDPTGTHVQVSGIHKDFKSLETDETINIVTEYFAIYLSIYPNVIIVYNGHTIDPSSIQKHIQSYHLPDYKSSSGKKYEAELVIIEWLIQQERELHLCDQYGVSLHQIAPGVQAPGCSFTAYLKSDIIRELDAEGRLILDELDPDVIRIVDMVKEQLRKHFRSRASEEAKNTIAAWKENHIYPYDNEPSDEIETVEREVFDILALNINSYLPDFESEQMINQRFTFNLIKQAIRNNPESLQGIIQNVLNLPKESQDTFAKLLKHTSLSNIINAAKIVSDRLNFLRGLETLIYDDETKEQLLERDQLHKILETETWIFGEHFNLTCSEQYLEDVAHKYLSKLKDFRDPEDTSDGLIVRDSGKRCRIDLLLTRTIPQPRSDEFEHLIIELKRPSKKIDLEILTQIKSYAFAVARDERFHSTNTRWEYWVVSNEMTEDAKLEASQQNRPSGIVHMSDSPRITVIAKTWSEILSDCYSRLRFFRERLNYEPNRDSAREYLRSTHEAYLPKSVKQAEAQISKDLAMTDS